MARYDLLSIVVLYALVIAGVVLFFVHRYWYEPRQSRLSAERLRREEAAGVPPSARDYEYAINFDADGFTVTNLRRKKVSPFGMRWAEICRATAFKRDEFTVDCICLFLARADGSGVELNEDMASWNMLMEALPQCLAGCRSWSEWFSVVAFPPFATNETEIYAQGSAEAVRSGSA